MLTEFNIREIISDANRFLLKDIDGNDLSKADRNIYWYLVPIALSIGLSYFGFYLNDRTISLIITALSIFSGLSFNLLIVIVEKASNKKEKIEKSRNEEDINYLKRVKNFSKILSALISYSILVALGLIFLLLISNYQFFTSFILPGLIYKHIVTILIIFYLYRYVLLILLIVSKMYELFYEEIE